MSTTLNEMPQPHVLLACGFSKKASADQARVVAEHRAVQQPEAARIDEDPGAFRTFKYVIAFAGCLFPGKRIPKPEQPPAFSPIRRPPSSMCCFASIFESVERRFLESQSCFPYSAYNADTRRMAGNDITLTGGADGSGSATISKMLHSARTAAIRSRMRRNGSRTMHFENWSHSWSPCAQAIIVKGPSMASRTAATEVAAGAAQLVTAVRTLVRDEQTRPCEPRQHLGHQLDWNVIAFGDLPGSGRPMLRIGGEMLHRHQGVIRFLRKP